VVKIPFEILVTSPSSCFVVIIDIVPEGRLIVFSDPPSKMTILLRSLQLIIPETLFGGIEMLLVFTDWRTFSSSAIKIPLHASVGGEGVGGCWLFGVVVVVVVVEGVEGVCVQRERSEQGGKEKGAVGVWVSVGVGGGGGVVVVVVVVVVGGSLVHGGFAMLGPVQSERLGSKTVIGPHIKRKKVCFPFRLKSTHLK
jgi:hypothetical protein